MKNRNRILFRVITMAVAILLVVVLAVLSIGNSPAAEVAAEAPASEVSAAPATPYLTLGYTPSDGFNPYIVNSSLVMQNSGLLFERLVEITPTMELDYRLAQSIDTTDTQVIINLRGGCYFADGTPIGINDLSASFLAALQSTVYGGRFTNVANMEVVENSLVLTLASPDSLFAYLCDIPILKADEVAEKQPTPSGRYTYGDDETLVKNGRAAFGESGPTVIRLSAVNSYDEMVSGLAVGNLNLYSAARDGSGSAGSGTESYYKTNQLIFLGINSFSEEPLLNQSAGRALLSAITDRRQLAEKGYYSRAYPATGAINSFYPCVNSQQLILAEQVTDDLEAVMTSLGYLRNEAGLWCRMDGDKEIPLVLHLLQSGGNTYKEYAAALFAEQLLAQGIPVETVKAESFETYQQAVQTGEFELYIGEVKLYNNINLSPFMPGGSLSVGLAQSEELSAAYAAFKANKSAAGQFEQVFAAQMPYIPLLWRYNTVISGYGVNGLDSSLSNTFYSVAGLSVTNP